MGRRFLLNSPYPADRVWDQLPREVQQQIIDKRLRFYVVDGHDVARQTGMGGRINTPMQSCFFALAGLMPREEAIEHMKAAIRKSYGKRGETIVEQNFAAIDMALERLQEVEVPAEATGRKHLRPPVASNESEFVNRVTAAIIEGRGDLPARERDERRWHIPDRHCQIRKTEHRGRNSDLGSDHLH